MHDTQTIITDPRLDTTWDDSLSRFEEATPFHTTQWISTLCEAYQAIPLYTLFRTGDTTQAMVPCLALNGIRSRAVSLPFTDSMQPLCKNIDLTAILNGMVQTARGAKCRVFVGKGWNLPDPDQWHAHGYFHHRCLLTSTTSRSFRESTRRNIRKAQKEDVEITWEVSEPAMREYYRMHCITRKRQGTPPQPSSLFRAIHRHIITPGNGRIALAKWKGKSIAGAVFFRYGIRVLYKFGASDPRYHNLRANNLLMAEAINTFFHEGCTELSFGKTEPFHTGLLQFKRGFSPVEETIYDFAVDTRTATPVTLSRPFKRWHTVVFRAMPIPVLRLIGRALYRFAG